jgi:hypothetical protein
VWAHGNILTHGKVEMRTATIGGHGKGLCRAYVARRTAKIALPFATLPCALCLASTHGKAVAVRFVPFTVPGCRTAKLPFPVVNPPGFILPDVTNDVSLFTLK